MNKEIFAVTLVVLLLLFGISPSAWAQNSTNCYSYPNAGDLGIGAFCGGLPVPPWAELIQLATEPGGGCAFTLFRVRTNACAPPGDCPCPSTSSPNSPGSPTPTGNQAGSPVSLGSGDTFIRQTDLAVPGLGGGLSLIRTWNSLWPTAQIANSIGIFGPNWRSTYEERVFVGSDYYIKYGRSDGSFWSFGLSSQGWRPATPANVSATLVQNGGLISTTPWILTFQNGEQRQFDYATGHLTSIIDRNGNRTQLAYDGSNRLVTVTSPASQHLYFNYGTGTTANLVTSVTSDFGVTLSYSYDAQGRLIQVTKPDLTTVSLTYNAQSEITAVTDNNGKVLESHTYDSAGRGLTSSQANGVNALTVTYP